MTVGNDQLNREPAYLRWITWAGLATALVLLAVGQQKVYSLRPDPALLEPEPSIDELSVDPFDSNQIQRPRPLKPRGKEISRLNDWQVVEHATFTGIRRHEGVLQLTYNPATQKRGKRSCPT